MPQPYDRRTCLEIPLKSLPLVSEQKWTLTFVLIARGTLSADVGQFELVVQGLNAQIQYICSLDTGLSSASKRHRLDPEWHIWRFFLSSFKKKKICKRLLITITQKYTVNKKPVEPIWTYGETDKNVQKKHKLEFSLDECSSVPCTSAQRRRRRNPCSY